MSVLKCIRASSMARVLLTSSPAVLRVVERQRCRSCGILYTTAASLACSGTSGGPAVTEISRPTHSSFAASVISPSVISPSGTKIGRDEAHWSEMSLNVMRRWFAAHVLKPRVCAARRWLRQRVARGTAGGVGPRTMESRMASQSTRSNMVSA
eukprot:scaffold6463_cov69-Phaeocystis_antarctica.AAC.3